jgi:Skp family chaperone for outer membrane proteins
VLLVIDRAAILQASKAGQDMGRQVQEYAQQARAELDPQGKALQAEEQSLKSQLASLSADARQSRVAAFEAKRDAFQRAATIKQNRIKLGLANAQHQMERALEPILKQIMIDRKANMIVDKQAVVFATDTSFDVSRDAVNRLDAVLPSVKVDLPPESAVTAQQQQQPQQ